MVDESIRFVHGNITQNIREKQVLLQIFLPMNVKELREDLKLTQQELAYKMGVTLRTIQNWEGGKPVPLASERMLKDLKEGRDVVLPSNNGGGSSGVTHDAERFYAILERQQELMSKQLEELAQFRAMAQKKETQIDMLLSMIRETYNKQ